MKLTSPSRRWTVPVAVGAAVAAAFAAPPLIASAGQDRLPDVTAEELLASVAGAEPVPIQGTVVYTARLGLPELPLAEVGGADPIALLGGSSTLRLWSDGESRSRVALLGSTSEYSVVRDGTEAWTYSSADDEVVHYSLSPQDEALVDSAPEVVGDLPTPQTAAEQVLSRAEEFSTVSVDGATTVAGRGAYQLVVSPRQTGSLVARVVIAVDAETSTPLRVQVWSTQDPDAPALEVGFTDVEMTAPDPSVLEFSTPAGAAERDVVVPLPRHSAQHAPSAVGTPPGTSVTGTGWETVVEVAGLDVAALVSGDPSALAEAPGAERTIGSESGQKLIEEFAGEGHMDLDTGALYDQLTTQVPEGRLLASTLLSVLVTEDGRVLVGAVPAESLRAMA